MLQASCLDGLALDPFAFGEDGLPAAEVDIGGRQVAEALMIAALVVMLDEGCDLPFEILRQIVVFQQDAVLQGLVPALDLALCLGMVGRASDVLHALAVEPGREVGRDVGRAVVAQQPRPVRDRDPVEPCRRQRQIERGGDVVGAHRGAELPGDDIAREVVEDGREIIPAPAGDLQVGEVGLPELVRRRRLVLELGRRLDDDVGRAGDQVLRLQQPIHRRFRDEVALLVGEAHRQLARAQFRLAQRQFDDLGPDRLGDPVPDAIGPRAVIGERLDPAGAIAIIPAVERGARDAERRQRAPRRQM